MPHHTPHRAHITTTHTTRHNHRHSHGHSQRHTTHTTTHMLKLKLHAGTFCDVLMVTSCDSERKLRQSEKNHGPLLFLIVFGLTVVFVFLFFLCFFRLTVFFFGRFGRVFLLFESGLTVCPNVMVIGSWKVAKPQPKPHATRHQPPAIHHKPSRVKPNRTTSSRVKPNRTEPRPAEPSQAKAEPNRATPHHTTSLHAKTGQAEPRHALPPGENNKEKLFF